MGGYCSREKVCFVCEKPCTTKHHSLKNKVYLCQECALSKDLDEVSVGLSHYPLFMNLLFLRPLFS